MPNESPTRCQNLEHVSGLEGNSHLQSLSCTPYSSNVLSDSGVNATTNQKIIVDHVQRQCNELHRKVSFSHAMSAEAAEKLSLDNCAWRSSYAELATVWIRASATGSRLCCGSVLALSRHYNRHYRFSIVQSIQRDLFCSLGSIRGLGLGPAQSGVDITASTFEMHYCLSPQYGVVAQRFSFCDIHSTMVPETMCAVHFLRTACAIAKQFQPRGGTNLHSQARVQSHQKGRRYNCHATVCANPAHTVAQQE
jgi:hypothetical protein